MIARTSTQNLRSPTAHYAPDFQLELEGQAIPQEMKGDVLSLRIDMELDRLDRFELTLRNWDERRLTVKYSDSGLFEVSHRVTLKLGFTDHLVTVMQGQLETLALRFPENGNPTLTVAGTSGLGRLRGRKPGDNEQKVFRNMADHEIAQLVAQRNALTAVVTAEGPKHELVWQRDLDDAAFLLERARRADFELYVQVDPTTGQEALHFVKPGDQRGSAAGQVHRFEWGHNLISFMPRIRAARQVASVTVHGWDPQRKKALRATADSNHLPPLGQRGRGGPDLAGNRSDHLVDAPVQTQEEAQLLAESLLREKAYEYLTGEGQVMGLPELRPGHNVELVGLGQRFSGTYYVRTVSHSIGKSGFVTTFGARRPFDGGHP